MGYESSIKKKSLDGPQDGQNNSSHSSLRFEHSSFMCSQGYNGDLEPVHDLSSSQIYPHNEKSTSLGCDNIHPSARQSSPQNNKPDSPICTPQKVLRTSTTYASIKQASGSNLPFQSNYVNNQRDAIIKDLGNGISRGSLEYFKKILPPIRPEFDINKISSHLIKNGDLVQEQGIYVWKAFRMPTAATMTVNQFFNKPLVNVFNIIRDAALETSSIRVAPTVDMVTDGNNAPWSVNGSSAKPDGYLILKEAEKRIKKKRERKALWYNVAVSLEFKKKMNLKPKADVIPEIF